MLDRAKEKSRMNKPTHHQKGIKMKKRFRVQKEIVLLIKASDFEDNCCNYGSNEDCIIARCIKRTFNVSKVHVGVGRANINGHTYQIVGVSGHLHVLRAVYDSLRNSEYFKNESTFAVVLRYKPNANAGGD